jgi:hypothetical protein
VSFSRLADQRDEAWRRQREGMRSQLGRSLKGDVSPSRRTHGRVETGDVKLILHRDRKAVQRADKLSRARKMSVELGRTMERRVECDLGQAVGLRGTASDESVIIEEGPGRQRSS